MPPKPAMTRLGLPAVTDRPGRARPPQPCSPAQRRAAGCYRVNETVTAAIGGRTTPDHHRNGCRKAVMSRPASCASASSCCFIIICVARSARFFLAYSSTSPRRRFLLRPKQVSVQELPRPGGTTLLRSLPIFAQRRASRARGVLIQKVLDVVAAPAFDVRGKLVAVMCVVGLLNGIPNDWASHDRRWTEERALGRELGFLETAITTVASASQRPGKRTEPPRQRETPGFDLHAIGFPLRWTAHRRRGFACNRCESFSY